MIDPTHTSARGWHTRFPMSMCVPPLPSDQAYGGGDGADVLTGHVKAWRMVRPTAFVAQRTPSAPSGPRNPHLFNNNPEIFD